MNATEDIQACHRKPVTSKNGRLTNDGTQQRNEMTLDCSDATVKGHFFLDMRYEISPHRQLDKLLFGEQRPLAASPRTDPASGAERHTVTNLVDKLLFEE